MAVSQLTTASSFLEWLLARENFKQAITTMGYFEIDRAELSVEFEQWHRKQEQRLKRLELNFKGTSIIIPSSFSTDFYSQMPSALQKNGLYLLRKGSSRYIVFNGKVFQPPFLHLGYRNAADIPARIRKGYPILADVLSVQWNEQSFIKALHFCGVFKQLVDKVCKARDYEAGPSGPVASTFPFWMKSKRGKLHRFVYEGVDDLDECIYPRGTNIVMPIEAKVNIYPDLGWHKLAFPCYRFIDNSKASITFRSGRDYLPQNKEITIIPVYCMFNPIIKRAYIYVFSRLPVYKHDSEKGIILNNPIQLHPRQIFTIDMKWIWQLNAA